MKRLFASALASLALSASGLAMAETFQPADFGQDTLEYLEAAVARPELTPDKPVAAVYCQTDVARDGHTGNVSCYEREGYEQLRDQVEEAFAGRQFRPARVGDEAVAVRMVFRVIYADSQGQPPTMLLPNLGHMQGDYGYQYSAPQERLDENNWYARYRDNGARQGQPFFSNQDRPTRVMAWVNEAGRVASVHKLESHVRRKRDANAVAKALRSSRFIPGMVEGEPERMRYVAVLHYPE